MGAPLPDTSSPKTSQTTPTTPSRLSSERTSTTSSSTPPRTSSSSSTPHGADTANPLPQSGTSSVRSTRITLTSSSPSLTPPLTNSKMSRSRDSPPSNSSQLVKAPRCRTTTVAELLMTSSSSSSQKPMPPRKPPRTSCKHVKNLTQIIKKIYSKLAKLSSFS